MVDSGGGGISTNGRGGLTGSRYGKTVNVTASSVAITRPQLFGFYMGPMLAAKLRDNPLASEFIDRVEEISSSQGFCET